MDTLARGIHAKIVYAHVPQQMHECIKFRFQEKHGNTNLQENLQNFRYFKGYALLFI